MFGVDEDEDENGDICGVVFWCFYRFVNNSYTIIE